MTMATTTPMTHSLAAIEGHLRRLGAAAGQDNPEPLVVLARPDLPLGWVEVGDPIDAAYYGPASAIEAALSRVPAPKEGEATEEDYAPGWEAAHDALGVFRTDPRLNWRDWPEELFASGESGRVVSVLRNDGQWYSAAPDGENTDILAEAFRYGCWFRTPEEAVARGFTPDDPVIEPVSLTLPRPTWREIP
jgi:hypothetical protein